MTETEVSYNTHMLNLVRTGLAALTEAQQQKRSLNNPLAETHTFTAYYSSDGKLASRKTFAMPNLFRQVLQSYWPISEEEFPLLPEQTLLPEKVDGKWVFVDRTADVDAYFEDAWKEKRSKEAKETPVTEP